MTDAQIVAAILAGARKVPPAFPPAPLNMDAQAAPQAPVKSARQVENEAMQRAVNVLLNGARETARNVAICEAYLSGGQAAARQAAASCPAPAPVATDPPPKAPALKPPKSIKAPPVDMLMPRRLRHFI